jgi:carboxylesterase type B
MTLSLRLFSLFASVVSASSLSVSTNAGDIHGGLCNGGVDARFFKSIPYAKPPIGSLRFQLPQAYPGKYPGGSLNGSVVTPACIQFGDLFVESPPYSEDW